MTAKVSVAVQKPEQEVLGNTSSCNLLSEASAGCVVKPDKSSRMEPMNMELYLNSGWLVLADSKKGSNCE